MLYGDQAAILSAIGQGYLGDESLRLFLAHRRTRRVPFIIETPKGTAPDGADLDAANLAHLRRLARA